MVLIFCFFLDKDGKVSVDEYIGDMFRVSEDGEEEPDWVKNERETFASFRDKDHDGYMDNDEVRDWIIPAGLKRFFLNTLEFRIN